MAKTSASEDFLGTLHQEFARTLSELLKGRIQVDKEGAPVLDGEGEPVREPPTAAELSVIAKFLKDNDITASVENNDALKELAEQMERRRARKAVPASELADAAARMHLQ